MSYSGGTSYNQGPGQPPAYGAGTGYNPGGFSNTHPSGPPPGADPQLWQWFSSVDSDRSGSITAQELQQCLINGDWTPFDLDTVKLLMSIFDTDRSGTIGFNEFCGLWKYIKDWQGVFRHFDRDQSGSMDRAEMQRALHEFGYRLPPTAVNLLLRKYATSSAHVSRAQLQAGAAPVVTFDHFVRACVAVKMLTESFQRLDVQRSGWIQVNYEQFMDIVLTAP